MYQEEKQHVSSLVEIDQQLIHLADLMADVRNMSRDLADVEDFLDQTGFLEYNEISKAIERCENSSQKILNMIPEFERKIRAIRARLFRLSVSAKMTKENEVF